MRARVCVVGGGAVGLHAALKAAVLGLDTILVDKGRRYARVAQAPAIANIPGMPGVSGAELLDRLGDDLARFEKLSGKRLVRILEGAEAVAARRADEGDGSGFAVTVRTPDGEEEVRCRALVLATGIVDRKPGVGAFHARGHETMPFLHRDHVGYCLLCEGWSLEGKDVAVVGCAEESVDVARAIKRRFGGRVTLLTDGAPLEPRHETPLRRDGVPWREAPIDRLAEEGGDLRVVFGGGEAARFDKLLFSLGWYKANNELAVQLGAATTPEGFVVTDANSEALDPEGARIENLFAVGDVRAGRWKQVVVGWGDAESAVITAYARGP